MFEQYLGRNQCKGFKDPLTRRACDFWLQRVLGWYGGDEDPRQVDVAIIDNQLPLTAETADYIYSEFTPAVAPVYERGSRPLLEGIVDSLVTPQMSDREKALVLMRRCNTNWQFSQLPDHQYFNGGTEEELVKRGAIMCNEISRVFAVLAQVAGLPSRIYSSHITGHMMNEVYVDGKWWWIDVMFGFYYFLDDGTPASAWDLLCDPGLFDRQKKSTFDDWNHYRMAPFHEAHPRSRELNLAYRNARYRDCYFNAKEAAAIGNYGLPDFTRMTFPWRCNSADPAREAAARHELAQITRDLGWPMWFWDFKLFDEELKTCD